MTAAPESGPDAGGTCPRCGEPVDAGASFCEACGKPLDAAGGADGPSAPAAAAPETGPMDDLGSGPISAPAQLAAHGRRRRRPRPRACLSCGGVVGPGRLLRVVRDQGAQRARPLPRAARVVGGGRVRQGHPAQPQRGRDGAAGVASSPVAGRCWSSSTGSRTPTTPTSPPWPARRPRARCCGRRSRAGWAPPRAAGPRSPRSSPTRATRANDAVVAVTDPDGPTNPASATFVVAVLEGSTVSYANIGDSRAYWLPDGGPAVQLSVDDSAAQEQIAAGVRRGPRPRPRRRRTRSPSWLGRDAPDLVPRVGELAGRPGRAGCWSAPTGCGTTPPSPTRSPPRSRAAGHRPTRRRSPSPWSASPTRRADRTTSPPRSPGSRAAGRMRQPHRQHPSRIRRSHDG